MSEVKGPQAKREMEVRGDGCLSSGGREGKWLIRGGDLGIKGIGENVIRRERIEE